MKIRPLQDRVIVKEKVFDIEEYVQAADIGVFASEAESFCLSILEGMCFGCPSVATADRRHLRLRARRPDPAPARQSERPSCRPLCDGRKTTLERSGCSGSRWTS